MGGVAYTYGFVVWPDETNSRWTSATFHLFRAMTTGRVELDFTEREFRDFRAELAGVGLTLREIERFPRPVRERVQ